MDLIYKHEVWSDDLALEHENAMIASFDQYTESLERK